MTGEKVTLIDMLDCRERRSHLQDKMIREYHCPVISFCMNIPGPIKTNPQIRSAFLAGKNILMNEIKKAACLENTLPVHSENVIEQLVESHEKTGDELLMAVSLSACEIKKITVSIEETHPYGRLFDMDVIDVNGQKLSRPTFRKCIICGRQAQECARMRRHTIKEMQHKINEILKA